LCGNRLCWECDGEGDECLCVQLTHVYQNSAAYSPETIVAEDVKPSATPLISTETSDIKASPVYAKKEEAAPEPFVDVAVGELPSDEETRSENKVATHRLSCRFAADDIWTACKMGDLEYVQQALQAQPHLLMAEYNGRTPLFLASLCGQATVVDFLLSRGALDPGGICYQSALGDACRSRLKRASRQQQQHQGVKVKPSPSSATSLRRRPRRAGRTRMPSTQPGQSPLRVRGCLLY
jgi:ankyrin repeat protein